MTYAEKIYDLTKKFYREASIKQSSFDIVYNRKTKEVYVTQEQVFMDEEHLFTIPADTEQGWFDSDDSASIEEQYEQAFETFGFDDWFYYEALNDASENFDDFEEVKNANYPFE